MPLHGFSAGLFALFLLCSVPTLGQTIRLRDNTFRFAARDTTILNPVLEKVRAAQVLFVGELDHGDGSFHEVKLRLLQQLHHEKPVAVVFEADFFALNHRRQSRPVAERLRSLYPVWTDCAQFAQVMDFLVQHQLEVYGADPQLLSPYSQQYLRPYLDSILPANPQKAFFLHELKRLQQTQYSTQTGPAQQQQFLAAARAFQAQVQPGSFDAQLLQTVQAFAQHMWQGLHPKKKVYYRDQAMGANLFWLKSTWLPDSKTVFLGANAHIGNRQVAAETADITSTKAAFDSHKAYASYSIALIAYEGVAMRPTLPYPFPIPAYRGEGLEKSLVDLKLDFALVDLQAQQLQGKSFYARGFDHLSKYKAVWSDVYDCFLFTRVVTPCGQTSE